MGEIVRDEAGNPTGVLKDNAMGLVYRVMPEPSEEQLDRALAAISQYVAAQGVTTVHDMAGWQSLRYLPAGTGSMEPWLPGSTRRCRSKTGSV